MFTNKRLVNLTGKDLRFLLVDENDFSRDNIFVLPTENKTAEITITHETTEMVKLKNNYRFPIVQPMTHPNGSYFTNLPEPQENVLYVVNKEVAIFGALLGRNDLLYPNNTLQKRKNNKRYFVELVSNVPLS
jgi:hypothetical protein